MSAPAQRTGRRSLLITFISWANIALFTGFGFYATRAILRQVGTGQGASDTVKILIALAAFLFCALFVSLGFLIMKQTPPIYYDEEGFTIGKKGEKILYKGLQYHIAAGRTPNSFAAIFYKSQGKLKGIRAILYASKAFAAFQEGVVRANLPQAIEKIEKGGSVTFRAVTPKIRMGGLKGLDRAISQGIEVKVSKESIAFDDEIYRWADYTIISDYVGLIVVLDPATNRKVMTFSQKYLVEQPHVLTQLVNILGGR